MYSCFRSSLPVFGSSSSSGSVAAVPQQQQSVSSIGPVGLTPRGCGIDETQLPSFLRRKPMTEDEINAINVSIAHMIKWWVKNRNLNYWSHWFSCSDGQCLRNGFGIVANNYRLCISIDDSLGTEFACVPTHVCICMYLVQSDVNNRQLWLSRLGTVLSAVPQMPQCVTGRICFLCVDRKTAQQLFSCFALFAAGR